MDVAVTGSGGLIGSELVEALEADGHRVVRVRRGKASGSDELAWDPDAGTIDAAGLEGIGAVIHLAGEPIGARRWTAEQKRRIRESRLRGTALVASAVAGRQRPPGVLLSASGINVYGNRGDQVLTEASTPADTFLAEVCVGWEAATAPAAEAGVRVANLRTGIVLTKDGGALAKLLPLFRFGLGGRFGSGRQYWSWISLADEVAAIRFLLDHDVAGPVNLTAPEPVTNKRFTEVLARVMRRPALLPVPSFGPSLVVGRELANELLYSSLRVVPDVLRNAGFTFAHPDLEEALRSVLA